MKNVKLVLVKTGLALMLVAGLASLVSAQADSTKAAGAGLAGRRPFQARMIVTPGGNGFETVFMPIPAGKRLVIENISAIARTYEGQKMEINYFTYMDNNGDGDASGSFPDITFHRVALTEQGTFGEMSVATANHKVLVFAEEQIGASHYQVGVQARLNALAAGTPQAQVTFSGYLEDLTVR